MIVTSHRRSATYPEVHVVEGGAVVALAESCPSSTNAYKFLFFSCLPSDLLSFTTHTNTHAYHNLPPHLPHQTNPTHRPHTLKMSAPNVDKPNEGIVGQITNSVTNAANYVSETVQGKSAEASKEANKEQMKGNTPNSSVSDRVSGAMGAASDKMDQAKHDGAASANKHST
ncbi:hypothetical protein LTR12_006333 [Friedmanniomyces endolithicus]|nr:hypothetical protein LTR12_006333 [Friedmanniomyces endolithicus]